MGAEAAAVFVCTPCGLPCDLREYTQPGTCPVCGMALIPKNAAGPSTLASALAGAWAGSYGYADDIVPIRIDVKSTPRPFATLDLSGFAGGYAVKSLTSAAQSFSGSADVLERRLQFTANVDADNGSGTVTDGSRRVPLSLQRIQPLDLSFVRGIEGAYRVGSRIFLVEHLAGDILAMNDQPAGTARVLFTVAPGEFVAGPTLFSAAPAWRHVRFDSDARGAYMSIEEGGTRTIARRVPLRSEPVTFTNGDVRLSGTLTLPEKNGRHPAIVYTHGSGPNPRSSFSGLGYFLAMHGIAALKYDKRGVGESTGDFTKATFENLADDAIAGAQMLRARGDIAADRVGFWGQSQGSAIAPLAASRAFPKALVIAASGGGLSIDKWSLIEGEAQLRSDGHFSEADIAQAMQFERLRDRYMRTREGWQEYADARKVAVTKSWYAYPTTDLFGASTPESTAWNLEVQFYFRDPRPALRRLRGPFLGLYGENDPASSGPENVGAMRDALSANNSVTLRIIPKGDHNFFETNSPNASELPRARRFKPGFFQLVAAWASRQYGV